ncbi:hypothetical protein ACVHNB_19375 [Streptomyces sp. YJ-C3]
MVSELPDELLELQRAADDEGRKLEHLDDGEREKQREVWFAAAAKSQAAVSDYAARNDLNRYEVEKQVRQTVRHPPTPEE